MTFIDAPRRSTTRRWLFLIHLWLGLIIGPVVGVVCLTGAIVVFRYELNRVTTPGTAYVSPQARRLSVDTLVARFQTEYPEDRINQIGWGEASAGNAWNVRSLSPEGHRIHTYVNQYTGDITGRDDYHDKWMQWFYDLHAYLLGGDIGEFINGFVGLTTLFLSVTGLVIWWPGTSHWLFGFTYAWGVGWKRQNYDLHKIIGFYSSVAVLIVAFTGMSYSFPGLFRWGAEAITGTRVTTGAPHAETTWSEPRVPLERFVQAAEAAQPGAMAVQLGLPQKAGDPVMVRTKERSGDWHRVGLSYVYFEPSDARIIRNARFSEASAATQAILFMTPLHFGRFGGRWNRVAFYGTMVLYVVIGLSPFVLTITGFLMYWNRSFVKKGRRARARAGFPLRELSGRAADSRS